MTSEAIGKTNGPETVGNSDDPPSSPVSDTAPDGTVAGDGVDAENGTNAVESGYNDRNSRGQFVPGNKGGPGRGRYSNGSKTGDTGASGVGELSNAEMRALIDSAIRRRDERFWDELVIKHPVSAAQMRQGLIKADGGAADAEPVRLELGDLGRFAANVMTPPVPDDLSGLDADALRQEITRLRDENADLERKASGLAPLKPQADDKPLMAVPSKEAVECFSCKHRTPVRGRMIEPLGVCASCGQTWQDSIDGRFTPPAPDPQKQICPTAFTVGAEDRAWASVDAGGGSITARINEAITGRNERPLR